MANGSLDTAGGLFRRIDEDLTPFLAALDRGKDSPRTPLDIISRETREMVFMAQSAFHEAVRNAAPRGLIKPGIIAQHIRTKLPDLKLSGGDNVGFAIVPGTEKIDPNDIRRNMVIAYIDYVNATSAELQALRHWHVGASVSAPDPFDPSLTRDFVLPGEYAETNQTNVRYAPKTGLVWADADRRIHMDESPIRIAPHGTLDDYSAYKRIKGDGHRSSSVPPSFYFGPYYGGIDMKSSKYPDIRRLGPSAE